MYLINVVFNLSFKCLDFCDSILFLHFDIIPFLPSLNFHLRSGLELVRGSDLQLLHVPKLNIANLTQS